MKAVRIFVTGLAVIAGLLLFALAGLVTAGVVMRYGFNMPLVKAGDWTQLLMLIVVGFGLAYCGLNNAHVAIDIFTRLMAKRAQRILMAVINALGGALLLLVAWEAMNQGRDAAEMEQLTNLAELPMVWFFMLGAASFATYAIVLFCQAVSGDVGDGEHP